MYRHSRNKEKKKSVFMCPAKKGTHKNGEYVYPFRSEKCPNRADCCPESSMKPLAYVNDKDNYRIFTEYPGDSKEFRDAMKLRSASERSNGIKRIALE